METQKKIFFWKMMGGCGEILGFLHKKNPHEILRFLKNDPIENTLKEKLVPTSQNPLHKTPTILCKENLFWYKIWTLLVNTLGLKDLGSDFTEPLSQNPSRRIQTLCRNQYFSGHPLSILLFAMGKLSIRTSKYYIRKLIQTL